MEIDINKGQDINVSEDKFWNIYLKVINLNYEVLTDREIDVLSIVLAGNIDKPIFKRASHKRIAATLKMSIAQLSHLKKSLMEKGFLKYTEDGIIPHDKLQLLRKYIRSERSKGEFPILLKLPYVL